jgi:hypothetical protein
MTRLERKKIAQKKNLSQVIMLSAWGFTLVVSSFLFLFVGRWIDVRFHTEPAFMIGLFILAISLCIGRIYMDFTRTKQLLNDRSIWHGQA